MIFFFFCRTNTHPKYFEWYVDNQTVDGLQRHPNMGGGDSNWSPLSKSWHNFHIWVNYHFNFSLFGNLSTFWFLNILNNPLIILILSLFDINNVAYLTLYITSSMAPFLHHLTVIFSFSSPLHLPSVCAMLPSIPVVAGIPYWNTSNSIGKLLHSSTSSTLSFSWSVLFLSPGTLVWKVWGNKHQHIYKICNIQVRTSNCYDDNKHINVFNCCILVDSCTSSLHL